MSYTEEEIQIKKQTEGISPMRVTKQIRKIVKEVSDARCSCDVKIPLADILTLSMCAILLGNETIDDKLLDGISNKKYNKLIRAITVKVV